MTVSNFGVRIESTGRYLPARSVSAAEIDVRLGLAPGGSLKLSGVATRRFVDGETASDMGAAAALDALASAGLTLADIDLLICSSGTPEQPIPCNAALVQKKLGDVSGMPCFDVNSTCMSFLVALDVAGALIATGRYKRILVVSSDVASCGMNEREPEAYALLGDAAAAAVLSAGDDGRGSGSMILGATFATYSEGSDMTEIRGGGSAMPAYLYEGDRRDDYLFHMDGTRVFRMALKVFPPMVERLLADCGVTMADIDLVVPHQASQSALELMRRRLNVAPERWAVTLPKYGNTISSSIPLALDDCLREGRLKRGQRVLLLGTSAGFSAGAVLLDF
jgi:3-oxoacyl-[acyl-carrier-protein] synthase-3